MSLPCNIRPSHTKPILALSSFIMQAGMESMMTKEGKI